MPGGKQAGESWPGLGSARSLTPGFVCEQGANTTELEKGEKCPREQQETVVQVDCKGGNRKAKADTEHGRRCIRAWPLPRCGDQGEQRSGDCVAARKLAIRKMAVAGTGNGFGGSEAWKCRVQAQDSVRSKLCLYSSVAVTLCK